jgi:glucoamylase
VVAVLSAAALLAAAPAAMAKPQAPGAPGAKHSWAPADKHGFGSARQPESNAWFTLRQASLSEVYYPDLSTPSFRGLQFAVTDGKTFVQRETVDDDADHIEPVAPGVTAKVTPLPGSLGFEQVTTSPGKWRLTKTYITDPARPVVLVRVRFESLAKAALRLYVLADPAPGDDGNDDRSAPSETQLIAVDTTDQEPPGVAPSASAIAASPALEQTTSGYRGTASDPWQDLQDYKLTGYDATTTGNVVQGARTQLDGRDNQTMTLAIGFGTDAGAASSAAAAALAGGFTAAKTAYDGAWSAYLTGLKTPASVASDPQRLALYQQSLLVLAASEDKLHPGASIAAPNMPWVWGTLTLENHEFSGPYHLVWPRDFYHVATAQKAAGDDAAATRLLNYLWEVQKPDGSFWQNTRVDGTPYWTSQQLDETSLPVVLAWWLGRRGADDWVHIRAAADYVAAEGPDTGQERWENQGGWSPNTIATEIAALICAADVAEANGDDQRAEDYRELADSWQQQVEDWTATSTGPYDPKPYYLRITKPVSDAPGAQPDPDVGTMYSLGDNHSERVDQREIVDNSFLGLVLFGVKPWDDPVIQNSLAVGDKVIQGPAGFWHRFTFDGYGETTDGRDWNIFPTAANQTLGRSWPLLTGERGEYELIAKMDATPRLATMAGTANDGLMLPEQVWDGRPGGGPPGTGTRSATPLAWTHAQFVRLAWSIDKGEPIERPAVVACRYQGTDC